MSNIINLISGLVSALSTKAISGTITPTELKNKSATIIYKHLTPEYLKNESN